MMLSCFGTPYPTPRIRLAWVLDLCVVLEDEIESKALIPLKLFGLYTY